jgi:DNA-binding GntR family transcriptional regulator
MCNGFLFLGYFRRVLKKWKRECFHYPSRGTTFDDMNSTRLLIERSVKLLYPGTYLAVTDIFHHIILSLSRNKVFVRCVDVKLRRSPTLTQLDLHHSTNK